MRSLPPVPDRLKRWAIALALAALAAALQWAVRPWVGGKIPFLFFQPAILLASVHGGRSAGLLVALAGCASRVYTLMPDATTWIGDTGDVLSLAIYMLFALLLATIGGRMHLHSARASAAEQRLLLAGEDTGIGIFEIDLAAGTVYLSPALAALGGIDAAGPVPIETLTARLPAELRRESRAALAQKLREHAQSYERELQATLGDGHKRWLMLRVHIAWSGDRAVRLRGACIDITERKAVDALLDSTKASLAQQVSDLNRLHELSSRLLETTALAQQLALILDAVTEFHGARRGVVSRLDATNATATICASTGFDAAALATLARLHADATSCAQVCAQRDRIVLADTEDAAVPDALRTLARKQGFRAVHGTPLIGQRGDVLGAISIQLDLPRAPTERECRLADICARKAAIFVERAQAQSALEETQGRFQAVLDASAAPFVLLVPLRDAANGRIVDFEWGYVNAAAARALRRPPEAFLGKHVQEVLPERWSTSESFAQYIDVVENAVTREFETHVRYEGADQWFQCIASPMRGDVALWFTDVTARKRDEKVLQDADRRKDEFLATLAHELRNPLAPIRQAAAVSRLPQATEAQKRWSHDVIERQVRHMALLLDDLLDVSRITRGALALRRGPNALGEMLEAAIETARPLLEARHHELELVLPQAGIVMQADPLRVSQMIANLLANAAKYTDPNGRIRLLAALDDDDVVIEVSDNGIGIADESLPAVFDMFTQLRGADDRAGGLGIGLALTKGLVELHGGSIAVRSGGVSQGSTFTVRLPRGAPPALAPVSMPDMEPRAAPRRRVLIADDNRDAAESLAALLELEGHEVALAFDGEEALRTWQRLRPDVCLLDIGMPNRTGNEVASEIRAREGGAQATLVAITGWGQDADRRQALAAGFDHHLTKPVDPALLLLLLTRVAAAPHWPA